MTIGVPAMPPRGGPLETGEVMRIARSKIQSGKALDSYFRKIKKIYLENPRSENPLQGEQGEMDVDIGPIAILKVPVTSPRVGPVNRSSALNQTLATAH